MNAIEWTVQLRFAVALALGFLVGLERESAKIERQHFMLGGVRTYPLISMLGFGCAWLHQTGVSFALPIGLLGMIVLTGVVYSAKARADHFGATSEVSALLTYVSGARALLVDVWAAMALSVCNTILLSEKARLEAYVEKLNKAEFLAVVKFLLVTIIILPVLPNQEYTRFNLNPTRIWEVVILVSTIGFVGYFLSHRFGDKVGLWLSGLLGGIVSSTALTIAAGRLARKSPSRGPRALQSAILASSVMYVRILVIVAVVNPLYGMMAWWKMLLLAGIGLLLSVVPAGTGDEVGTNEMESMQNPFEITPALVFAALFVVLLVVTSAVKSVLGVTGILALAGIVGVADVDPFVLSVVQNSSGMMNAGGMAVIIALMSNTAAKGVYFWFLVPGERRHTAWRYALWTLLHIPFILMP